MFNQCYLYLLGHAYVPELSSQLYDVFKRDLSIYNSASPFCVLSSPSVELFQLLVVTIEILLILLPLQYYVFGYKFFLIQIHTMATQYGPLNDFDPESDFIKEYLE